MANLEHFRLWIQVSKTIPSFEWTFCFLWKQHVKKQPYIDTTHIYLQTEPPNLSKILLETSVGMWAIEKLETKTKNDFQWIIFVKLVYS